MIVSKIWVVLLAGAAVAGLGVARLVPNPAAREVARAYADNLDRGQHNADLILRLEARDWIDAVAKMAWDGTVVDLLEQSSNRRGDLRAHSSKLKDRLLALLSLTRAEPRPQLIIAVDHLGKQIARVGPGDDQFTPGEDGLGGYPLVEAALRGYRTDDTWKLNDKLLLMAASPVIARSRGRYVGALLVGLEIDDAFAQRLKSRLAGTDLCFFMNGKLVAATVRPGGIDRLPAEFTARTQEIKEHGRSAVIRLAAGSTAQTAILAALPGEAAAYGAFYAAIGAPVPAVGLGEMLGEVGAADLRWAEFPWPLLLGLLVMAVAVGLALLTWEHDLPLRRLLGSAEKLKSGEAPRLDEFCPGRLGQLARLVNEANERLGRRAAPAKEASPTRPATSKAPSAGALDVGSVLDTPALQPLGGFSGELEEISPPMAVLDTIDPDVEREPDLQPSRRQRAALSLVGGEPPLDAPADDGPGAAPIEIPALNLTITSSSPRPAPGGLSAVSTPGLASSAFELEPGLDPAPAPEATATMLKSLRLPESEEAALSKPPPLAAPEPKPLPPLESRSRALTPAGLPSIPEAADNFAIPEATPIVENPEEEYYQQVFKNFLAVKQQCGESTSALTFERFAEKLRKNRNTLLESYHCKSVKFQVYIKDGKAALKATPVKD